MDRDILVAPFQKIREPALYLDSARWRQPRGLGVWAIDALQCDSNQSDEGAGVGRDEQRVAWENKASQSDSCTIIYSSSMTLTQINHLFAYIIHYQMRTLTLPLSQRRRMPYDIPLDCS